MTIAMLVPITPAQAAPAVPTGYFDYFLPDGAAGADGNVGFINTFCQFGADTPRLDCADYGLVWELHVNGSRVTTTQYRAGVQTGLAWQLPSATGPYHFDLSLMQGGEEVGFLERSGTVHAPTTPGNPNLNVVSGQRSTGLLFDEKDGHTYSGAAVTASAAHTGPEVRPGGMTFADAAGRPGFSLFGEADSSQRLSVWVVDNVGASSVDALPWNVSGEAVDTVHAGHMARADLTCTDIDGDPVVCTTGSDVSASIDGDDVPLTFRHDLVTALDDFVPVDFTAPEGLDYGTHDLDVSVQWDDQDRPVATTAVPFEVTVVPPNPVRNLTYGADADDVVVTWDAPEAVTGGTVVGYDVSLDSQEPTAVTERSYRMVAPPQNVEREVRVRARVDYGTGGIHTSDYASITTDRPAAPNMPVNIVHDEQNSTLSWDKPAKVGNQEITGFLFEQTRNGEPVGSGLKVDATEETSYTQQIAPESLPAGEWVGTVRTLAGDARSPQLEVLRHSVDLPEPTVLIAGGKVEFGIEDDALAAVAGWRVQVAPKLGGADLLDTEVDAAETSVSLPANLATGAYTVTVTAIPFEGFDYDAGVTKATHTVAAPQVPPTKVPATPQPGALTLSPLTGPRTSPLGGSKTEVAGTVIRDGKPVAGQRVTVKYRKNGQKWKTKKVTTDAKGRYSITVKANRFFRAYAQIGKVRTKRLVVRPTAKVTLTQVSRGRVKVVTVGYAKARPKVSIQAKVNGTWTTVAKARSKTGGRVTVKVAVAPGTKLRAVSQKTEWVRSGTSRTLTGR